MHIPGQNAGRHHRDDPADGEHVAVNVVLTDPRLVLTVSEVGYVDVVSTLSPHETARLLHKAAERAERSGRSHFHFHP